MHTVLVVEDDAEACEMLRMTLGDRGARVHRGHDFDSAVRLPRERWPDVLASAIAAGFDLHLTRPLRPHELIGAVARPWRRDAELGARQD